MSNPSQSDDWETMMHPALPTSEDHIFTSEADWWNNACLNWCPDGWGLYASGYKDAADLIVKHVEKNRVGQDSLVYPTLFLYRQYLELHIKDLIRQGHRLRNIREDFPKHHRIGDLWMVCHKILSEISPGDSQAELKEIGRLIAEFSEVDPSSFAFRYPHDKDGNPTLEGITHINLRNVREVIDKISTILMGADAQIGEYLSLKLEMEREFGDGW